MPSEGKEGAVYGWPRRKSSLGTGPKVGRGLVHQRHLEEASVPEIHGEGGRAHCGRRDERGGQGPVYHIEVFGLRTTVIL